MSGEFLGTFTTSVNKQKWITIPAELKKKFSKLSKMTVVATIGPENNIAIYPLDNWEEKIAKLDNKTPTEKKLLENLRSFADPAQGVESNGRIKLNDELLGIGGIEKKVVIKGEGKYIAVWKPERFYEYRRKQLDDHNKSFSSLDYQ